MRIMIKGGVWKNTEDEILKAAVMKYGKNQWARISSLLVRKSAKQCKARWYEWLDPSIKKTEWTREEDEKLLHLAKLMPTQWRTIAPIVGRTPSQCLERYEKLLDAACVKDENYEPGDDPRKLRPGEIDPNPESKPARPDPVDMDEDEKEMLSEARARLANTRGKKAKRKAREKQLEEARRLASLQKRRELKAAGIDNRHRKRKRKGIDYNAEIPFQKKPPPGFFDVTDEDRPVEQPKFPTTIEELEGKRRVDVEAQLRKQDVARNKIAQRQDAPSAIMQANKLNDPEAVRKRSKLMLPPPQISDHELEEIAKMGYASDLLGVEELAGGSGATSALLANYSQTPRQGMTPLRTPQRTPGGKADAIMMEAENLARLRESQTPLLGGDNPDLHPSDFSGVTPRKRELQTPNPMATPLASPGPMGLTPRIGMTPSRDGFTYGITPKGTPLRDELHINEDMDMLDSAKMELRRQAELRRNLRSNFSTLPPSKNEYEIAVLPIPEENEEVEDAMEEDMSDRIARAKAEEAARQEALLRKRSKVLQRDLPRPPAASLELIRNSLMKGVEDQSSFVPPTPFEQADEMIRKELLVLLEHDNAKYPLEDKVDKQKRKGSKRASNEKSVVSIPEIEDFEEDRLKEADSLIKEEVQFLRTAMGHENESLDDFVKARDACQEDLMYFPGRHTYGLASVAGNSEKLAALQDEFDIVKKKLDEEAKKATRLEQKIEVLTRGYQLRETNLMERIHATFKQIETAETELECFRASQRQEQSAVSYRTRDLVEEINKQKELERCLQQRYGDLVAEQDRVQRLLEHKLQLKMQEEIAARERAESEALLKKQNEEMEASIPQALSLTSDSTEMPDAALIETEDTQMADPHDQMTSDAGNDEVKAGEHSALSDGILGPSLPVVEAVTVDSTDKILEEKVAVSDGSAVPKISDSVEVTMGDVTAISDGSVVPPNLSVEEAEMLHSTEKMVNKSGDGEVTSEEVSLVSDGLMKPTLVAEDNSHAKKAEDHHTLIEQACPPFSTDGSISGKDSNGKIVATVQDADGLNMATIDAPQNETSACLGGVIDGNVDVSLDEKPVAEADPSVEKATESVGDQV
ncbi:Cell division cycle 5-like protein [Acorus calamus]|uniref:Cell division cycle 5-like protein n=1 Tax=Acorus calamus TaxID=4465 RepID=A0AAV9E4S8_ACOCL|nr:Cell division cycle 5-like protein [Acorus calamus]